MGVWQGIYQAHLNIKERKMREQELEEVRKEKEATRKEARELFNLEILERRKDTLIGFLTESEKEKKAQKAQVALAVGLGVTKDTATALQQSGQLGFFLDQYEKNKKVDPEFVKDLNTFVSSKLKEVGGDAISKAMVLGVSTERDVADPAQSTLAMVEAIYGATSSEQLDEVSRKLYDTDTATGIAPFRLDFSYASGPEETETKNIRSEIATKLQPYFTDAFIQNPETGETTVNQFSDKGRSVAELLNKAEERARDMAFGPTRSMTPTNAAATVAKNLETALTQVKTLGAKDILTNFDAIMVDPVTFATRYIPTPVVEVPEPAGQQVEQAGDDLGDSYFSIIEEEEKKRIK
jgi:hypothetical protein